MCHLWYFAEKYQAFVDNYDNYIGYDNYVSYDKYIEKIDHQLERSSFQQLRKKRSERHTKRHIIFISFSTSSIKVSKLFMFVFSFRWFIFGCF